MIMMDVLVLELLHVSISSSVYLRLLYLKSFFSNLSPFSYFYIILTIMNLTQNTVVILMFMMFLY